MPREIRCRLTGYAVERPANWRNLLAALDELAGMYSFERRGIRLVRVNDTAQLVTAPEYADAVRTALEMRRAPALSQPSLEVLAIIAANQPTTRAYIEQVRGVDSSYTVGALMEKGIVEEAGRLDVPGRPMLLRTTPEFLRIFGVSSYEELAELPEIQKLRAETPKPEERENGHADFGSYIGRRNQSEWMCTLADAPEILTENT